MTDVSDFPIAVTIPREAFEAFKPELTEISFWCLEIEGAKFPMLRFVGGSDDVVARFPTELAATLFKLRWM